MLATLTLIGVLLAAGIVGGWVARLVRLPSLTGYLGAGIAAQFAVHQHWVGHQQLEALRLPINDLAMALALFVLGGQFRLGDKAKGLLRLFKVSALDAALTLTIVGGLCWFALGSVDGALLLGVLAIAVAPATTLEVLHEYQAKGPVTRAIKSLTALSNIWAVFLFEAVLLLLIAFAGGEASLVDPVWDLVGSIVFGLIAGHLLILLQEQVGRENDAVPLLAIIFLTIGVCTATDVPHMLAFLVTGAVVVNRSRFFPRVTEAMSVYAQPAFVLFFVLSGSHLDFGKLFSNLGVVALYVGGRSVGKIVSMQVGLKGDADGDGRRGTGEKAPLGLGLLCQAGAAIALASYVGKYDEELSQELLSIILGGVVIFELVGPILVKRVAVSAGEVSLRSLLTHSPEAGGSDSLWASVRRTLRGRRTTKAAAEAPAGTVGRFMRPNVAALPREAGMDDILRFANSSPYSLYPVVDPERRLLGLVSLAELSQVAYDPGTAGLVTAEDLTTIGPAEGALTFGDDLDQAAAFFQEYEGDVAAVIESAETPVLVGLVERPQVLQLLRRRGS
jgi:Kef-type K+ transport system membrane component KefB/CBS domain-containing protein